jgi:hypothetical protein
VRILHQIDVRFIDARREKYQSSRGGVIKSLTTMVSNILRFAKKIYSG